MAIAEHSSTPAPTPASPGDGIGNVTTAAFSPPAESLLVAMVVGGWGQNAPTGVTITDSGGHTWTAAATATGTGADRGVAAVFRTYLASGATNITVTAAYTNLNAARLLDVRVLTGASADQSTASSVTSARATATTAADSLVSLSATGSQVYGICDDPDTISAFTPNGSTTVLTDYGATAAGVRMTSWKGTATTPAGSVGTSVNYGGSWATAQTSNLAAIEVVPDTFAGAVTMAGAASFGATPKPPPGVFEHSSTPAVKTQTGNGPITTAAFSPPANSLLVAFVAMARGNNQPTVTDSGSHTWTNVANASASGTRTCGIAVFVCPLTTAPGSSTVTATFDTANVVGGTLLAVRVLTGADPDQLQFAGAYNGLTSNTAVTAASITATPVLPGSRIYGVSVNPDNTSAYTPTGATTAVATLSDATDVDKIVFWRATALTPDPVASITLGGTWTTGNSGANLWYEIEPPSLTASLSAVASFAATPSTSTTYTGAAAMAGAAALSTAGVRVRPTAATMAGAGSLTAGALFTEQTTTTLAGTAGLTAGATKIEVAATTLVGVAGLTAAGFLVEQGAVLWPGAASFTASGTPVKPGAATLAGAAVFTASGVPGVGATLLATSILAGTVSQRLAAAGLMAGSGTFGGPGFLIVAAAVTFPGTAGLVASLSVQAASVFTGTATLSVAALSVFPVAAMLSGVGALTLTAGLTAGAAASLAGVASLAGSPFRIAGGTGVLFSAVAALRAAATGVTPGQVLSVSFWALNNDGTYNVALPDVASWQLSLVDSSPGAITLDYPVDGRNFSVLRDSVTSDHDLLIAVWIGGKDLGSLRALLNTTEGDDVAESALWKFSGNFLAVRMEEAVVAPRTVVVIPPQGPAPTTDVAALRVYAATMGAIMGLLMTEAHTRGVLSDITTSFTDTVDSRGVPWSKTITLKIAPGTDYLKILTSLVDALLGEWDVIDHELVLWEYGTRGVDYTLTVPPLILRAGDNLTDSPRKHTVRDAGTTLVVAGAEGLYRTVSDATAVARRGRVIERYESQGYLTDVGSLAAYGAAKLPTVTNGVMECSHGIALTGIGPEPLIAYRNGDWCYSDTGLGLERLRIRQLTVSSDANGELKAGVTLNDLIASQLEYLNRKLAGITGGFTITGTSNAEPVIPTGPDTTVPNPPAGVVVTSLAQPGPDPIPKSAVYASWAAPILNTDGTACADLAGYQPQWRYLTAPLTINWVPLAFVGPAQTSWSGVIAGQAIEVRVAAYDLTGNTSTWSLSAFHTTQTDLTPPPVPSTPVAANFLGTITLKWDGTGSAGEVMPLDFVGVQIHRSITTGFAAGPATFVENMFGPGARNYPGLPLGVTQFFRLISYDRAGNPSDPSAQASAIPAPVGIGDIAFSDPGNLVEDGSFEVSTSRATHTARSDAAWSFVSGGADNGTWFARGSGSVGSGLRALVLSPLIPTTPGSDYAIRWAMRATGVNGDMSMRIRWTLAATTTDTISLFTTGFAGAWTNTEVGNGVFTAPAGAVSLQIIVMLHANCTTGTWDVDRVEARETIGTLLVRNLAVTDAQIASASVGKLTAGTITAVMLMAGLLRSAATGLRYEMDANGLRFYDTSNNVVIDLNRASASATMTGTVQTGVAGQRIVLSGAGNDIRFYPQAGETRYGRIYTYIPANFPNDIAIETRANSSTTTDYIARHYLLPDDQAMIVSPTGDGGDLLSVSSVNVGRNAIDISYRAITGPPPYVAGMDDVRGHIYLNGNTFRLESTTSGTRDGGYLWLDRTTSGSVYFGLKTATTDNYIAMQFDRVMTAVNGSIGINVFDSRVEAARFTGFGSSGKLGVDGDLGTASFRVDATANIILDSPKGSVYVKNFVIDHPVPGCEDRWLVHACTESPVAGVEYSGTTTVTGWTADVALPDYFEALTRIEGRQVFLQVMLPAGGLHPYLPRATASYPVNGRFRISTDALNGTVISWLVKAIRADVPLMDSEPNKTAGSVHGTGPYTYFASGSNEGGRHAAV